MFTSAAFSGVASVIPFLLGEAVLENDNSSVFETLLTEDGTILLLSRELFSLGSRAFENTFIVGLL